jgi:phosphatidylglycerophosphatase A
VPGQASAATRRLAIFLATAAYVGYFPFAPGTAGSVVGLLVYAAIRWTDRAVVEGLILLAAFAVGTWAADRAEEQLGKDPSVVVIDEVVGMLVTLAFLQVTLAGAAVAFLIFRVFDVLKPYPAGRLEHLHGGPGIMLDDVMAGIYGNLTMRLLIVVFPGTLA